MPDVILLHTNLVITIGCTKLLSVSGPPFLQELTRPSGFISIFFQNWVPTSILTIVYAFYVAIMYIRIYLLTLLCVYICIISCIILSYCGCVLERFYIPQ